MSIVDNGLFREEKHEASDSSYLRTESADIDFFVEVKELPL